jgi:hypothetical protein
MNVFQWLSENWELVCIAFGVFVNALGLAYNVIKYLRHGGARRAEHTLALLQRARELECEAEALAGASGAEKLEYVLAGLRDLAKELGEDPDRAELSRMVEEDIAFSKRVNADKSEVLE